MANKLVVKKKINLAETVKQLHNARIKVGYPQESSETLSDDGNGVSALYKAVKNNFGIGVPKRPFMDVAFWKNKEKYDKLVKSAFAKMETINFSETIEKIGMIASQDVKKAIVELSTPANSAFTIKQKGSSNPLVDSGHMMQSTTYQIIKE